MSLRVLCPNGHLLSVQQQYVGTVVRCPLCGLHLMVAAVAMPVPGVPAAAPSTAPPSAPPVPVAAPPPPPPPLPAPAPPPLDLPGLAPLTNDPWPEERRRPPPAPPPKEERHPFPDLELTLPEPTPPPRPAPEPDELIELSKEEIASLPENRASSGEVEGAVPVDDP